MRVAIVSYDFGEYCVRLANGLGAMADVLLLIPEKLAAPHLTSVHPRVKLQPFEKPRLREGLRQVRLARHILRQVRRFNPDVVHVQQGHLWFNWFLPVLSAWPLVLTVHDPRHHLGDRGAHNTPQAVMDFGFRRAARLVVHARELKRVLVQGCGVSPDIVDVIPHVSVGAATIEAVASSAESVVLFFGRIWPYKGLEYLIRAEPFITARVPDVRIVIAGAGEDLSRYRRMMVHPERFVVHNEFISDERCRELFHSASVVVLPYVEASQSGVIPVAYSFLKPVVATAVGGLPDIVDDGRTGFLVPPRDERALADAVVRVLRDKTLAHQLGVNGRRKLDLECSPAAVAQQTLAVYQRVVADARSRPAMAAHH